MTNALVRRRKSLRAEFDRLEERVVLSGDSSGLFGALTSQRYWIDYSPSYDSASDPYNANPSDDRIQTDLQTLFNEGFRGLVTYTLLGSYANIPKIAKSVGFDYVIAGIYYPDNATEVSAASSSGVLPYTDAFVVGNEGLQDGRYTTTVLTSAINQVKTATSKPVTTSEPGGQYYAGSPNSTYLLGLGDWLFPNIDYFLFPNPSTPAEMWTNVSFVYNYMLTNQTTSGPVVAKEVFYPTAGDSALASDTNQIGWYGSQAVPGTVNSRPFYFVWGEAFDQPWKTQTSYEPHMGLHGINNADGSRNPKPIIAQLKSDFSGRYGAKATKVLLGAAPRPGGKNTLLVAAVDARGPKAPKGTVRFFRGDELVGTAKTVRGVARLRVKLPIGRHELTAVFEGTRRFRWASDDLVRRVRG